MQGATGVCVCVSFSRMRLIAIIELTYGVTWRVVGDIKFHSLS